MLPISLLDLTLLPQTHSSLRQLRIDTPCFPSHLDAFATLPCLEDLSIRLRGLVNSPIRFRTLSRLTISVFEWLIIEALFIHMDAPCLRTFSITTKMNGSNTLRDDSAPCMRAVSARFPHLTDFHWRFSQSFQLKMGYFGDTDVGSPLAELIEPLFALRDLRSFSYNFLGPVVPFSSADIERIAEAWPDLVTCRLIQEDWHYYVDFASIVSLARHCRKIRTLWFPRIHFDLAADDPAMFLQDRLMLHKLSAEVITCPQASSDSGPPVVTAEELRRMVQEVFPWAHLDLPSCIETIDPILPNQREDEYVGEVVTVIAVL